MCKKPFSQKREKNKTVSLRVANLEKIENFKIMVSLRVLILRKFGQN